MKIKEIKDLFKRSFDPVSSTGDIPEKLEEAGVKFDFSPGFNTMLAEKIFGSGATISREVELLKSMYYIFNRVAITGIAAIIILLISIFLSEGNLSLNSFLGLSDTSDESIVYLLTGI